MTQLKKIKAILLGVSILSNSLQGKSQYLTSKINIYDTNYKPIDLTKENKELCIFIENEEDLTWLKEYTDLETLKIYNTGKNTDISFLESLSNLKKFTLYESELGNKTNLNYLENLTNLEYLEINTPLTFDLKILDNMEKLNTLWIMNGTYKNIEQLKEYQNIKELRISVNENTPRNLLESLTHLKKLKLYIDTTESLDYQKFIFLDELSFGNSKPYSIIVNFSTNDYNYLINHSVKIVSDKEGTIDKIILLNKNLDEIINTLNIKNDSEEEKLKKAVIYILEKLTYDETVEFYYKERIDIRAHAYNFYKEGLLYGALEMDSAICGSYASLLKAILKRIDIECIYLQNEIHAWNLVKINNKYYYIDATLLDKNTELNYIENKKWYLEDPNNINDESHVPNNFEMKKVLK